MGLPLQFQKTAINVGPVSSFLELSVFLLNVSKSWAIRIQADHLIVTDPIPADTNGK